MVRTSKHHNTPVTGLKPRVVNPGFFYALTQLTYRPFLHAYCSKQRKYQLFRNFKNIKPIFTFYSILAIPQKPRYEKTRIGLTMRDRIVLGM